jgi:TonB family protein
MKELSEYFIQSGASMIILYGFYWLLLRKETCFSCNRAFLLFALLFSAMIPFSSHLFSNNIITSQYYAMLEPIIISPDITVSSATGFNIISVLIWIYLSGAIINIVRIIIQVSRMLFLAQKCGIHRQGGMNVVYTDKSVANFSFFNIVFLSKSIGSKENAKRIITHEKAHIRQKHFIDLIIIELMTTIFWFNPVIWFYRRSLVAVHEYLADEYVLSQGVEKISYQKLLVTQSFGLPVFALANNFNQSLIKRRFIMMSKTKTKVKTLFRLLLVLPVIFIIIFMVSCSNDTETSSAVSSEAPPPPPPPSDNLQKLDTIPKDEVFVLVEDMPEFPGGDEARNNYLTKNIKYPEVARKEGIEGRVFITFVVEKDGSIADVKVLRGIGGGCDEEAVRVIENMPVWIPGKQRGKNVRVQFNMPIVFKLNGAYKEIK